MKLSPAVKTLLIIVLKLGVTALAVTLILRKVDLRQLGMTRIVHPAALAGALGIAIFLVVLQAQRWRLLLQTNGIAVGARQALSAVWFGHFLNNLLPTSAAGDVVRNFALRYQSQQQGLWLGTLVAEKYVAMVTALLTAGLAAAFWPLQGIHTEIKAVVWIVLAGLLMGYAGVWLVRRIFTSLLSGRLQAYVTTVSDSIGYLATRRQGHAAFLLSLVITLGMSVMFYLCALSLDIVIDPEYCAFIVPVFSVIASLPISYGGWGVREYGGVQLMGLIGIDPTVALAVCVLYGLVVLASSLPGVLAGRAFMRQTRHNRKLHKAADPILQETV